MTLREYFIGDVLNRTEDPFEQARAILLLRLTLMFLVIFLLPIITDYLLGYEKGFILHVSAFISLVLMLPIMKWKKNTEWSVNLFFLISFIVSSLVFMCLSPAKPDAIGVCWTMFFLTLSALIQRGKYRIIFMVLNGLPLLYIIINKELNGILTWEWIKQTGNQDPPIFLILFPMALGVYTVWTHTITIKHAKATINDQKKIIEEKNKNMTDSIRYAKRIQTSLLPTEKFIERVLNRQE